MRTRLRSKSTLFFVAFAALLLAVGGTAMALTADTSGNTAPAPTIQSDQADYAPGELVTLTGSNWQPGEPVHINVDDDQTKTWSRNVDVTADASGNSSDSFNLPDWFVATYKVTATGQQSGVATTSFTDGTVRVQARPSGTTFSSGTFTRYSQLNCAGPAGTTDTMSTVGSTNGTGYNVGLGNSTDSLLVKVSAATNSQGNGFLNFGAEPTSDSSFIVENGAFDPTSDPKIVCINANYNGNKTFVVNFGTPVANNDSYSVNEDNTLNVAAPGVLSNDTGTANSAVKVSDPAHGTVTLNANGSFTYTPAADYNGPDSFTYKVNNGGTAESNTATVNIAVNSVNDEPVANNDSHSVNEDGTLNVAAPGVLANDTDVDNPNNGNAGLTVKDADSTTPGVQPQSQPNNGTLTLNANGSFTYTPNANFNGTDSFTYKSTDGSADSNIATVHIMVTPVNDAPDAVNDTATTDEDNAVTIDVKANDTDVDGDTLTITNVTNPAHGTAVVESGQVKYTPATNYNGPDSFSYTISDGNGGTDTATVNLTVNAVNDAPTVTLSGDALADEGQTKTYTFAVSDPDSGDTFTIKSGYPDCGTGGNLVAGSLTTTASGGSFKCTFPDGPANPTVKIKVTDGGNTDSNEATKSVTVANVNPTISELTTTGSGTACPGSNNVVTLSFSITDPGVDTHNGTINWGDGTTTQFNGSSVTQQHSYSAGTYNITVNASDSDNGAAAPKSTTTANQVSLLYKVSELQDPVNPTGMTMSVFKYGSTVPLKVIITDCNNQPVNGLVPKISFTKVNPFTPAIGVNEGVSTQPNDTNFLMRDAGNGQYVYNLNTKSLADGDATYNATITDSKTPATYGPKVSQNFGLRSK